MHDIACIITSKDEINNNKVKFFVEKMKSQNVKVLKITKLGKTGFELIINKNPDKFNRKYFNFLKLDINFLSIENYLKRKLLLFSDLDSTVISSESIDQLSKYCGLEKQMSEITNLTMEGKIDFDKSIKERVRLLKGLHISELYECYKKNIFLNPGAQTLFKTMKSNGKLTVLVSGGFSFFANKIGKILDVDNVFSNELDFKNRKLTGKLKGEIINGQTKFEIMKYLCKKKNISFSEVISVGDGSNDVEIIKNAGIGVAFKGKEILKSVTDLRLDYSDISALLYMQGFKEKDFIL